MQSAGGFPFARIGNRALRIVRSCRVRMPNRPGMPAPSGQAAGRPVPPRQRHPIPLGWIRQSYVSLCNGHTRLGVAIFPNRGLRLTDRVSDRLPATRPPPTEGSSRAKAGSIGNAKAGTSGHMIRDGDGLRVVSEISVRFPFSVRRGRPLRSL